MSTLFKSFGAFIRQAAKYGIGKAVAISIYVEKSEDTKHEVKQRIRRAHDTGIITPERKSKLDSILDECNALYIKSGRIVDERDPSDWEDIGNGAKMHVVHKDSELDIVPHVFYRSAYLKGLKK